MYISRTATNSGHLNHALFHAQPAKNGTIALNTGYIFLFQQTAKMLARSGVANSRH